MSESGPAALPLRKQGLSIFWKLIAICVVPATMLFCFYGFMAHYEARSTSERELAMRLIAIASSTAASLRPDQIEFLEPGDEKTRTYKNIVRRLTELKNATGLRRVYLFDEQLRSRADTLEGVPIGKEYYHLQVERKVMEQVKTRGYGASLLYKGTDGLLYKTGYAAVYNEKGKLFAVVACEGSAAQFALLGALSRRLLLFGVAGASVLILLSFIMARRISRPLRALAQAAETMGSGRMDEPVKVEGTSEVAQVAASMERMRAELKRRDEQLRMMLAGIAHEVRNPLGGMELMTGMLKEELSDRPKLKEQVERIEKELDYLERVVSEFLEFARWSAAVDQKLDLGGLCSEVMELLAADAQKAGVELLMTCDPQKIDVRGDPDAIRRALINLIRNAVQATPDKGRVEVTIASSKDPSDQATMVTVSDTGQGIDPELFDKIFEPFYTTKQKGTGLGLSLVRKVAQAHGGRVLVTSRKGEGSKFQLRLPPA